VIDVVIQYLEATCVLNLSQHSNVLTFIYYENTNFMKLGMSAFNHFFC